MPEWSGNRLQSGPHWFDSSRGLQQSGLSPALTMRALTPFGQRSSLRPRRRPAALTVIHSAVPPTSALSLLPDMSPAHSAFEMTRSSPCPISQWDGAGSPAPEDRTGGRKVGSRRQCNGIFRSYFLALYRDPRAVELYTPSPRKMTIEISPGETRKRNSSAFVASTAKAHSNASRTTRNGTTSISAFEQRGDQAGEGQVVGADVTSAAS